MNSKLNNAFYRVLGSNQAEMDNLVAMMSEADTISDVTPLRMLRKSIDEKKVPYYTTNANWSNAHIYGIWASMFASNTNDELWMSPAIEHGLILYDQVFTDTRFTARAGISTFGLYRARIIRKHFDVPIWTVGPYIVYAKPYYSKKKRECIRRQNGKTLLVFPAHSTESGVINQNERAFIDNIRKEAASYDTVIVCAFWWNINDIIIDALRAEGYQIVSAGFRDDPLFLSRLRTIMELSDMAIADAIGTNTGYALALGLPFRRIEVGTRMSSNLQRENDHKMALMNATRHIEDTIDDNYIGLDKQVSALDEYWGFTHIRTREELSLICEITHEIALRSNGWTKKYRQVAESLLLEYQGDSRRHGLLREALHVGNSPLQ